MVISKRESTPKTDDLDAAQDCAESDYWVEFLSPYYS